MAPPRKLDANRYFNAEQKAVLFALANGCCQACGNPLGDDWHADHREPWSKGGRTEITNAAALCAPCNLWKGSRENPLPRPPIHSLKPTKGLTRFAKNNISKILLRLRSTPTGCLEWTGKINDAGYGVCMLAKRWVRVHRVVWEHFNEAVPEGQVLHHRCQNRLCANPWHLEPCTIHENLLKDHPDYYGKGPRNKTHCPYGHPLSGENVRYNTRGERFCGECRRRRRRKKHQEERALHPLPPRPFKEACPQGHPLSGDNLSLSPKGTRHCRACRREQIAAFNERKKAVSHGKGD
jgi:hypothetical protein